VPQALDFNVGEASGVECNTPRLPQLAHAVQGVALLRAEDFKQRAVLVVLTRARAVWPASKPHVGT